MAMSTSVDLHTLDDLMWWHCSALQKLTFTAGSLVTRYLYTSQDYKIIQSIIERNPINWRELVFPFATILTIDYYQRPQH